MSTKEGRSLQKARIGRVVSDRMDKTVVVAVDRLIQDSLYGKYMRKTAKVYAHDRNNECKIGDKVRVAEIKPLSKMKRWRVVDIIERAK